MAAQDSKAQSALTIGIRLNPEYTGILNKNDANAGPELDYERHFGYCAGVGATYALTNHIGLGVDILFSREGQAFSGHFTGIELNETAYSTVVARQGFLNDEPVEGDYVALAELNYIKLPLMISLSTDNSKPVFFSILAGPQINFLQGVAQEVNEKDLEYPNTDISPKDLYKPVTLAGMLALGAGINVGPRLVLSARLRMDYGFNDAEKKDAMIRYYGAEAVRFYSADRKSANSFSTGLMIGFDFKL